MVLLNMTLLGQVCYSLYHYNRLTMAQKGLKNKVEYAKLWLCKKIINKLIQNSAVLSALK
jgi:hypothetical protein